MARQAGAQPRRRPGPEAAHPVAHRRLADRGVGRRAGRHAGARPAAGPLEGCRRRCPGARSRSSLPLKLHELVDYGHGRRGRPRFGTSVFIFAMNKERYESLPDDLKAIIDAQFGREHRATRSARSGTRSSSRASTATVAAGKRSSSCRPRRQAEFDAKARARSRRAGSRRPTAPGLDGAASGRRRQGSRRPSSSELRGRPPRACSIASSNDWAIAGGLVLLAIVLVTAANVGALHHRSDRRPAASASSPATRISCASSSAPPR